MHLLSLCPCCMQRLGWPTGGGHHSSGRLRPGCILPECQGPAEGSTGRPIAEGFLVSLLQPPGDAFSSCAHCTGTALLPGERCCSSSPSERVSPKPWEDWGSFSVRLWEPQHQGWLALFLGEPPSPSELTVSQQGTGHTAWARVGVCSPPAAAEAARGHHEALGRLVQEEFWQKRVLT